jgi:dTDP-4-amino-4,6-dideoxygalactose transaminase
MARVLDMARRHRLFVVEDCALAVGSYYQGVHAGLHGDVGCFSFYPVKHLTTAEGGMVIMRDKALADALTLKRAFGVDRHVGERAVPGLYDVVALGFNYRMSEIHAAIGIHQMPRVPGFLERRRANYEALSEGLRGARGLRLLESTHEHFQSSYYCHSVVLDDAIAPRRPHIIESLKARGVGTSIYYPQPVPLMSYYRAKYGHSEREFPVAARLSNHSIALPVGPHLGVDDMMYIAQMVREALKEAS